MDSDRGENLLPQVDFIRDLIRECYQLERAGKMDLALQRGIEAERLARSHGENDLIASSLAAQAYVHFHLGHYPRARALAKEAIALSSPTALGRAEAYIVLGVCASETNDLDTAEMHYHAAADLSRVIGDHLTLARALHDLAGGVYWPRGQFDLALTTEREVLQISTKYNFSILMERSWIGQALVGIDFGDCRLIEESLRNLEKIILPGSLSQGYYYCLKADLCQLEGNGETAPDLYQQALTVAEIIGEPGLNILSRLGMSRFHRERAAQFSALPWAEAAVSIARRAGFHHMEGRSLIELGRVYWEMGNLKEAEACFQESIQRLTHLRAAFDLSHARLMLAVLYHQTSGSKNNGQIGFDSSLDLRQYWIPAARGIINGGYGYLIEREWRLTYPLLTVYLNDSDPCAAELASRALDLLQKKPPSLRIYTLGRFEVHQGNRLIPEADWRNRQAGELFRLLLVSTNHQLSREQIIEALWPEKDPDSSKAAFHQTTSALRRVLEPNLPDKFSSRYLFVEEGIVTLRLPSGSQVDFQTFEEHLSVEKIDDALALYQGEPFPLDLYHDWAALVREQINQQYREALLKSAHRKLKAADPQGALDACRRLLTLDPWQEQAVTVGMHACLELNDRPGAVRLYLDLEHCLSEDFGIDPSPELQQLYQTIQ
jgi:DNA-binding SARP family transcriptional activator